MCSFVLINDAPEGTGVYTVVNGLYHVLSQIDKTSLLNIKLDKAYSFSSGQTINRAFFNNHDLNRICAAIHRFGIDKGKYIIAGDGVTTLFINKKVDVAVIHHMNVLEHRENYSYMHYLLLKRIIKKLEKNGTLVIVASSYNKGLINKYTKISSKNVFVISPYSQLPNPSDSDIQQTREKYKIPESNVVLAVGTSIKIKNFGTLYKAIGNTNLTIVRAGGNKTSEKMEFGPIPGNVIFIDHGISELEMACFYRMAGVLAFTSIDEGLGLPLIEAMSLGTPVVGNRRTSIPGILGESQLMVDDPFDPDELRNAIMLAISQRSEYSDKAISRAKLYSMESMKISLLNVKEILDSKR